MSGFSNQKKQDQLGMPYGTASGRLKKMIMLDLLKRFGEDSCFKCGAKIENEKDLSVEHKIPWLDNDVRLFWDLANISFSHLKCNKAERTTKIKAPEGMLWCGGCKDYLDINKFVIDNSRHRGYYSYCRECKSAKRKRKHNGSVA